AITATTPSAVRQAATMPQASPEPESDGSTPTTLYTGRCGAAGNRQPSSHSRLISPPSGAAGTPRYNPAHAPDPPPPLISPPPTPPAPLAPARPRRGPPHAKTPPPPGPANQQIQQPPPRQPPEC